MGSAAAAPERALSDWTPEAQADRWFFTPAGNLLARVLLPTRIRANQVSFASMIAGLGAAVCYVVWTPLSLALAGVLGVVAVVLDAADGALARARRAPSEIGKLFDVSVDAVKGGALPLGLALGMQIDQSFGPPALSGVPLWVQIWGVSSLTGFSLLWQVLSRNHFVTQWELLGNGLQSSLYPDPGQVDAELRRLRAHGGFWLERSAVPFLQLFLQREPQAPQSPGRLLPGYRERLLPYMKVWSLFGGANQLSVLALASLAGQPLWGMLLIVAANVVYFPLRVLTLAAHRRAVQGGE
jgi:phosphatidylglycerophosphate synthase